ncbi:MAG TPA: phosphoenolpyruvate-utilizing N-terminal domain-containing protein, partial [Gemmatimonadales bacterium]
MTDRLLRGIGVSPGIAVGPAVVLQWALPEVPHATVPRAKVEKEIRRLRAAVRDVKRHIADIKARAESRAGVDAARIFDAQMLMLEDRTFIGAVEELIKENHLTAEKAFEYKALEVRDEWAAHPSPRLRERLPDLNNVVLRVLGHLLHQGLEDGLDAIQR